MTIETLGRIECTVLALAVEPQLLLSVKAAINWSRLHYQDLRAAGEHPEEEDELDVLAEEQFAEERKKLHRPKTWDDLARGLGQPLGYQGGDGVTT